MKNLFHAHVGWLFVSEGRATVERYVPDLLAERGLRVIHRLFGVWLAVSCSCRRALGYLIVGTWRAR